MAFLKNFWWFTMQSILETPKIRTKTKPENRYFGIFLGSNKVPNFYPVFKSIFGCTIWRHSKRRLKKSNIEFPIFCRRWNYIFLILFINIILLSLLAAYIVVHSCRLVTWIWHRYTLFVNDIMNLLFQDIRLSLLL